MLNSHELDQIIELTGSVSPSVRCWLTRGVVRCTLLGQLEDWDDLDIITEASQAKLADAIAQYGAFTRTALGGYRLRLESGRTVDIWSIENNLGVSCHDIATALAGYEFNVDAVAMLLPICEIEDPLGRVSEILSLSLSLQQSISHKPYLGHSSYVPLKAAYLVLRHGFCPTSSILDLWCYPPNLAEVSTWALKRLRDELRRLGDRVHLSNELALSSDGFKYYRRELLRAI